MKVLKLTDEIYTNHSGYKQITGIYHKLKDTHNQQVALDLYHLKWIDANLCALLQAVMYKLNKENGLTFSTDHNFLLQEFDVLFRNGFVGNSTEVKDVQESTVPIKAFIKTEINEFEHYVENDLIKHRGMPKFSEPLKSQIKHDLIEIFNNVGLHANTEHPVFVCGQYYPSTKYLNFTMVDLGDGFLPKIQQVTQGKENPICTSKEAVIWAVNGNSIKPYTLHEPGGQGISGIYKFCNGNHGVLQIATGDAYWATDLQKTMWNGCREITDPFCGTMINLFFRHR